MYQQTYQLLSICLSKGEKACCSFYQALNSEDPQLASDIREDPGASGPAEDLSALSLVSTAPSTVEAVQDTGETDAEDKLVSGNNPHSGVLQQVLALLDVCPGAGPSLNVCELGVAVGLPRRTVRESLLEEAGVGDVSQLRALTTLFLHKTQDAGRLLARVRECSTDRVLLSGRGGLLLKLLLEAEALFYTDTNLCTGHTLQDDQRDQDPKDRALLIFSYLLWEITAEALEDCGPGAELGGDVKAAVRLLKGSACVQAELLQELEECLTEGGTESLLQSIRVLAQVLRDLYPLQDSWRLSPPADGAVYSCHPHRLHRVTSFLGLASRITRRALCPGSLLETASLPSQYREVCLGIARLLDRVQPQGGATDLSQAPTSTITQHIHSILSLPAFRPQAFDAGVRHRILAVLEFDPVLLGLRLLLDLHRDTLMALGQYLKPCDQHSFQLVPETVQILGGAVLSWVGRVRGPVAIDNGMEEVLRFVISEPTSFLVRVFCRGYDEGKYFEVHEPRCVRVSGLGEEGVEGAQALGGTVLAREGNTVWMREGWQGQETKLEEVLERHSAQAHEEGCYFKVTSSVSECEVKVICKSGRLSAVVERNCEVV
ncbi:uncharacterized protein LOC134034970 [Osmerus eperlanus]|uniref:uncharacterized protein LOC134034970 n=1 Tax=Osmerus eperlanus TaxID=29151 RepID=UPI002E135F9B